MAALPRGAGVVARGLAPALLRQVALVARQRGLTLLVAGDGRAALALGAGLHLPDRRASAGLLPFLLARRAGPGRLILAMAAHGGQRGAARARRLGVDCLFLSPLCPTQSHPGAPALGPLRWPTVDLASFDWKAAALSALAFVLVMRLHWGLVQVVLVMAGLGAVVRFAL
jgi:hypothetical protein